MRFFRLIRAMLIRPIFLVSLRIPTRNKISYVNPKQRSSIRFRAIKNKLLSYKGTGPVGPAKYWEYPWALVNGRLFGAGG